MLLVGKVVFRRNWAAFFHAAPTAFSRRIGLRCRRNSSDSNVLLFLTKQTGPVIQRTCCGPDWFNGPLTLRARWCLSYFKLLKINLERLKSDQVSVFGHPIGPRWTFVGRIGCKAKVSHLTVIRWWWRFFFPCSAVKRSLEAALDYLCVDC